MLDHRVVDSISKQSCGQSLALVIEDMASVRDSDRTPGLLDNIGDLIPRARSDLGQSKDGRLLAKIRDCHSEHTFDCTTARGCPRRPSEQAPSQATRVIVPAAVPGAIVRSSSQAQAIQEHPEWRSFDDRRVVALARDERRVIVTDNLIDMRPLHYEAITPGGPGDYGKIFIPGGYPRTLASIGKIVAALEQKLATHPGDDDLANGEDWL
jgi:hypothetical protein